MADDTVNDLSAQPWPDDETVGDTGGTGGTGAEHPAPDARLPKAGGPGVAPVVRWAVPVAATGAALVTAALLARRLRR
jgi:hypothetical protein